MAATRWTKDQLKQAFFLYCQLPFGQLHQSNPKIKALAIRIGRTPSAVAMKLVNFASLDPAIRLSGRKGLGNASELDREVWDEFNADWERSALEATAASGELEDDLAPELDVATDSDLPQDYVGHTRQSIVETRIKQNFFRSSVLSSYQNTCCMSGVSDARLLTASHIVPWSIDPDNRLNPRNGLCLSAIHDRAYDRGLISVTPQYAIRISPNFKKVARDEFLRLTFLPLDGRQINLPDKFRPDPALLSWHFNKWLPGG